MAMNVVSIQYETDCTSRTVRIQFTLGIPVPPLLAAVIKKLMDSGDWNGFKAQAKAFAPLAISGALDFLIAVAPQKAAAKTIAPATTPTTNTGS